MAPVNLIYDCLGPMASDDLSFKNIAKVMVVDVALIITDNLVAILNGPDHKTVSAT